MDNKDFINKLSAYSGYTEEEIVHAVASLIDCMIQGLQEGKRIVLHNFGMFEVRKEMEYVSINPLTKQRFLVPPCLHLCYIPDGVSGKESVRIADALSEQNLIDWLVKEDRVVNAALFVESFFAFIKKALTDDKYVKVKGLGTFKMIDAGGAKSDSALLYENSVYGGISFLPDVSLRDIVNKPFAHFETIPLKENVVFADLPEISIMTPEYESNEVSDKKTDESATTDNSQESTIQQPTSCKQVETEKHQQNAHLSPASIMRMPWCMIACVLLVGIIVGGGIIWGLMSSRQNTPKTVVQYWEQRTEPVYSNDTVNKVLVSEPSKSDEIPAATSSSVPVKKVGNTIAVKKVLTDTIGYDMAGTQKLHTLRAGESLTKLALKYYGNKKLWPYLVRYNQKVIKNPDNIPVGTVIQIPVLIPKEEKR